MNTKLLEKIDFDQYYLDFINGNGLDAFPFFNNKKKHKLVMTNSFTSALGKTLDKLANYHDIFEEEIDEAYDDDNEDLVVRKEAKLTKVRNSLSLINDLLYKDLSCEAAEIDFVNYIDLNKNKESELQYISIDSIISYITKEVLDITNRNSLGINIPDYYKSIGIYILAYILKDTKKFNFILKKLENFKVPKGLEREIEEDIQDDEWDNLVDDLYYITTTEENQFNIYENKEKLYKSKKINKLLTDIVNSTDLDYTKKDIEFAGEIIYETILESNQLSDESIKEVKGNLINYFYLNTNYDLTKDGSNSLSIASTLGNSCMRYLNKNDSINLYSDNEDSISMLVKLGSNNKIRARAILWTDIYNNKYIDRVYHTSKNDRLDLESYAKQKGYGNVYSDNSITKTNSPVIVRVRDNNNLPYFDSLRSSIRYTSKNDNKVYLLLIQNISNNDVYLHKVINKPYSIEYHSDLYKFKEFKDLSRNSANVVEKRLKKYGILLSSYLEVSQSNHSDNYENKYILDNNKTFDLFKHKIEYLSFSALGGKNYIPNIFKSILNIDIDVKENEFNILFYDPINNKIPKENYIKLLIDLSNLNKISDKIKKNILNYCLLNKFNYKDNKEVYFIMEDKDIYEDKNIAFSELYNNYIYIPSLIEDSEGELVTTEDYVKHGIIKSKEFKYILSLARNKETVILDANLDKLIKEENAYIIIEKTYSLHIENTTYYQKIKYTDVPDLSIRMNFNKDICHGIKISNIKREGKYIRVLSKEGRQGVKRSLYINLFTLYNLINIKSKTKSLNKMSKQVAKLAA